MPNAKAFLLHLLGSVLTGAGFLSVLSACFVYQFIHGDNERYIWIINGPFPFSHMGSGPFQLMMLAMLIFGGIVLLALGIVLQYWVHKKRE